MGESRVTGTEMPLLNLAIYYGLPYSLLYCFWLYRMAWRLYRLRHKPSFHKYDYALVLGAVVFWVTGNTNPQMTAPFAMFAYMLLWVRILELKRRPVGGIVDGSRAPGAVAVSG